MKTAILLGLLVLSNFAFASHYDNKEIISCRVTRMVDYTYFEESLSANEYPDIGVAVAKDGTYSANFGGSVYDSRDEAVVSLTHIKHKGTTVAVKTKYNDIITLEVEYRRNLARATLRVKESTDTKASTLAYAVCDKGIL